MAQPGYGDGLLIHWSYDHASSNLAPRVLFISGGYKGALKTNPWIYDMFGIFQTSYNLLSIPLSITPCQYR